MKKYIISDPHYNHKNLVRGVSSWDDKSICRDFNTLEEHNEFVVNEINSKVNKDDVLYCLGDWSFGGIDKILEFREQINVQTIHLILDNHDHHIENNRILHEGHDGKLKCRDLFTTVQHYLEVPIPNIKDRKIIMFHYPIESWNRIHKGNIHLFGHQHSDRVGKGRKMDVGFDACGKIKGVYNLDECVEKLLSLEIESKTGDSTIEVNIK